MTAQTQIQTRVGEPTKASFDQLRGSLPENYTLIANGVFFPDIGVVGDWTTEDKMKVRGILESLDREGGFFGDISPSVKRDKPYYDRLKSMGVGESLNFNYQGLEFTALKLPPQRPMTKGLVLLLRGQR